MHSSMDTWKREIHMEQPEGCVIPGQEHLVCKTEEINVWTETVSQLLGRGFQQQATVALSTAEAEHVALSQAAQDGIWLNRLLCGLGVESMSTVILEDNQGAIATAKDPAHHFRTKHIDIRYRYIRKSGQGGQIELQHFPTNELRAEIAETKPLAGLRFEHLRGEIRLFPI